MDFFKAVFSDDAQPSSDLHESGERDHEEPAPLQSSSSDAAWSFGGLIKTLATKSESVIENYRRDLEEFSFGLQKETDVIREAASRAVKDLPSSLDAGASVAQESLESVGQAIDDIGSSVWNSTAQIISHGREALKAADFDSDSSDFNNFDKTIVGNRHSSGSSQSSGLIRYSRFDALVRALQSDVNTYLAEPEDLENYNEWKSGFELDKKGEEIENSMKDNGVIEEIYGKVVPSRIDHESFWSRYFYRLNKLKQAEDTRAKLMKRAISGEEEEDLSWDFDDEDDGNDGYFPKGDNSNGITELKEAAVAAVGDSGDVENVETGKKDLRIEDDVKSVASKLETDGGDKSDVKYNDNMASNAAKSLIDSGDNLDVKFDEKVASEAKTDNSESCKDSDISIVSSQPSMPGEEDLGWDEIEDIGRDDESKGDGVGVKTRTDLRQRLSTADQEEDLNWDTEE